VNRDGNVPGLCGVFGQAFWEVRRKFRLAPLLLLRSSTDPFAFLRVNSVSMPKTKGKRQFVADVIVMRVRIQDDDWARSEFANDLLDVADAHARVEQDGLLRAR